MYHHPMAFCMECGCWMNCKRDGIDLEYHRRPEFISDEDKTMSDEDWNIRKYIDFLRADEGDSVTLLCDNPDFNGQPDCAIECKGYWTNWKDRRYTGDTLVAALELAYFECRQWRENPPADVSPDPLPAESGLRQVLNFLNSIEGAGYGGMAEFEIARATVQDQL
jgi:hypothetical protein